MADNIQADLMSGSLQFHRRDGKVVEAGKAVGGRDEKTLRRS